MERHYHGLSRHPLYKMWAGMRERCNNPNHPSYHRYGGRGITVDPRWDDFAQFLRDMEERPEGDYSLDRINNDGPYSPENCRWATRYEQNANRPVNFHAVGERASKAKLTADQVVEIRQRANDGEGVRPLARAYGVDHTSILANCPTRLLATSSGIA